MNIAIHTFRSIYMIRLLPAVGFVIALGANTAKSQSADDTLQDDLLHTLVWTHSGNDGLRPAVEIISSRPFHPSTAAISGASGHPRSFAPYSVAKFGDGGVYTASLNISTRADGEIASFIFGGLPTGDPASGATINLDGALLGFKSNATSVSHPSCNLMVATIDSKGTEVWIPSHLRIYAFSTTRGAMTPMLNVKFNRVAGTWDLYANKAILLKGISLIPGIAVQPTIMVQSGDSKALVALKTLTFGTVLMGEAVAAGGSGKIANPSVGSTPGN